VLLTEDQRNSAKIELQALYKRLATETPRGQLVQ